MQSTQLPPRRPPDSDPSRTGATWVAGTGAFLLLAAAAVFVAVRWDSIPDAAKLAAIVAITGACLHVGHRYRDELPATASTLFHLGALLLPIDVAAVARHVELDWGGLLLAEGLLCLPAFLVLGRVNDSVVLRWAAVAAGLALSGGIGAVTIVPAPLALAAFAVVANALHRDHLALPWAAVAGLCPALAAAESVILTGQGTLDRLGLTGDHSRLTAALTAAMAATVLAREAVRRSNTGIALAAMATLVVGVSTTWTRVDGDGRFSVVGAAALFLILELVAAATADDRFWAKPTDIAARVAEAAAVVVPTIGVFGPRAPLTTALVLLGAGWVVAGERRNGGWWPATVMASGSVVAAVAVATHEPAAAAASMLGLAALFHVVRRPGGMATSAALAALAPLVTAQEPAAAVAAGVVGAFLIAFKATTADGEERAALAVASMSPLGTATAIAVTTWAAGPVLAGAAVAIWLLAMVLDRAGHGELPRFAGMVILAGALALPADEMLLVSAAIGLLAVIDTVRLDDHRIALGAAAAVTVALFAAGPAFEIEPSLYGVVLTTIGAAAVSAAYIVGERWRLPFVGAAAALGLQGLTLASSDPADFGTALLVAGAVAVGGGVLWRRRDLIVLGGPVMTVGIWSHLMAADVRASEPYLAPVALLLLAAGISERRRSADTNSWQAYGLPLALFGGAALAERLAGGGDGHALIAGAVGVAAVIVGGQRRLQAPLLLGTALLVVLTVNETLTFTAGVPTWVWLALAGSALLGAGVWMDRHEVGPIESGRRLVDVVHDRFA